MLQSRTYCLPDLLSVCAVSYGVPPLQSFYHCSSPIPVFKSLISEQITTLWALT